MLYAFWAFFCCCCCWKITFLICLNLVLLCGFVSVLCDYLACPRHLWAKLLWFFLIINEVLFYCPEKLCEFVYSLFFACLQLLNGCKERLSSWVTCRLICHRGFFAACAKPKVEICKSSQSHKLHRVLWYTMKSTSHKGKCSCTEDDKLVTGVWRDRRWFSKESFSRVFVS